MWMRDNAVRNHHLAMEKTKPFNTKQHTVAFLISCLLALCLFSACGTQETIRSTEDDGESKPVYTTEPTLNATAAAVKHPGPCSGNVLKDGSPFAVGAFEYDSQGRPTVTKWDRGGDGTFEEVYTWSYNAQGEGDEWTVERDGDGKIHTRYKNEYNAKGERVRWTQDDDDDGTIDDIGESVYNSLGQKTESRMDHEGDGIWDFHKEYEYDAAGNNILTRVDNDGDGAWDYEERRTFDGQGNVTKTERDNNLDGTPDESEVIERNAVGQETARKEDSNNDGKWDEITLYTYDVSGRLLAKTLDKNNDGKIDYKLTNSYDLQGNCTSTEDWDNDGKPERITLSDAAGNTLRLEERSSYDPGVFLHTYKYDCWDEETTELWADTGPTPAHVDQGNLGTCFFLSALAGMLAGDPHRVEQMFRKNPETGEMEAGFFRVEPQIVEEHSFGLRQIKRRSVVVFPKEKVWIPVPSQPDPPGALMTDLDQDGKDEIGVALLEETFASYARLLATEGPERHLESVKRQVLDLLCKRLGISRIELARLLGRNPDGLTDPPLTIEQIETALGLTAEQFNKESGWTFANFKTQIIFMTAHYGTIMPTDAELEKQLPSTIELFRRNLNRQLSGYFGGVENTDPAVEKYELMNGARDLFWEALFGENKTSIDWQEIKGEQLSHQMQAGIWDSLRKANGKVTVTAMSRTKTADPGIVGYHAFTVLGAVTIGRHDGGYGLADSSARYVALRNPWSHGEPRLGAPLVFVGSRSKENDDGVFLIRFDAFLENFSFVSVSQRASISPQLRFVSGELAMRYFERINNPSVTKSSQQNSYYFLAP